MARPTDVGSFGEALYAQLAPLAWDDEAQAWALLILCGGVGQTMQQLDEVAHSTEDGGPWSKLLDINRIPDEGVPWLGQFVGVDVDTALSVDDQRQQIRDHVGWNRGTLPVLINSIRPYLTGTQTVQIRERNPDAYHFQVVVYASEAPAARTYQNEYDDYATYQAIYNSWFTYQRWWLQSIPNILQNLVQALKPAGLIASLIVQDFQDYYNLWDERANYQAIYDNIIQFPTYQDIYDYRSAGNRAISQQALYATFESYGALWNAYQTYDDLYVNNRTF